MTIFIYLYIFVAVLWGHFTGLVNERLYPRRSTFKVASGFIANTIFFPISIIMACFKVKKTIKFIEDRATGCYVINDH